MAGRVIAWSCLLGLVAWTASYTASGQHFDRGLGNYCINATQCRNISNAYCNNHTCKCLPGYNYINNNTCSTSQGNYCFNNTECRNISNAYCNYNNCVCLPGYNRINSTTCIKTGSAGCTPGQCSWLGPGGVCNNGGMCGCLANYYQASDYCYEIVSRVDDPCNKNKQICFLRDSGPHNVKCDDSKCKCRKGFKASKNKLQCNSAAAFRGAVTLSILALLLPLACRATLPI